MLTYPKTRMDERWDMMPKSLREVLYSPAYGETVLQIAESHHLDEIKREAVARLTAFVIYGFIHPEELDEKIMEEIDVDKTTAKEVADEINKKIFEQFRKEISEMYSPISEDSLQIESIRKPSPSFEAKGPITKDKEQKEKRADEEKLPEPFFSPENEKKLAEEKNKPSFKRPVFEKETKGGEKNEPFVIHRGTGDKPSEGTKKSFQLGSFFGKEEKDGGLSAKIQTPFKNKEDKKTVHYSEYRSTMEPDKGKGFINIPEQKEKIITKKDESEKTPDLKRPTEKSENEPQKPKEKEVEKERKENKKGDSGPSVKGNTIDLRNL